MSRYYGEVINLSLRDISMLKKFKIVDIKKRFLGLVKIYTVELPSKKIEEIAKDFQSNMSTSLKKNGILPFTIGKGLLSFSVQEYLTYLEKVLHLFMEKCLIYPMQKIKKIGMN